MKRYFIFSVIVLVFVGSSLSTAKVNIKKTVSEGDIEALVTGNNKFAFELYSRLKDDPKVIKAGGNLFFSPLSISTALAMTYGGARFKTAEQMENTLQFPSNWELKRTATVFAALEKIMKTDSETNGYELHVANSLWGQKGYKFSQSFLELVREYYGAGLEQVDFLRETEKARKTINKWVEKQTKRKIKDLIPRGFVDRLTILVLTNAIYFKGEWASKFKEENTKHTDFHITEDKAVKVPMMYQKGRFDYNESENAKTLVLPYKGDELSMLIVLPKKIDELEKLEESLTAGNINNWLSRLRKQEVAVYLPKFKMTWGTFNLGNALMSMGMKDAFSLPPADFSGMTGMRDLFVSAVLHKAFIEINEEGTEAAAATAVVMKRTFMGTVFRADHPFIFMIKDNRTGSILFMGRVVNPVKSEK